MHGQILGQLSDEVFRQVIAVLGFFGRIEHVGQTVEGGETPVADFGQQRFFFLVGWRRGCEAAEVALDGLEPAAEFGFEAGMEVAIEKLVHEPAGDVSAANSCHFLGNDCWRFAVDVWSKPLGSHVPVFADVKCKVVDSTVEAGEACGVFVVVEGSA